MKLLKHIFILAYIFTLLVVPVLVIYMVHTVPDNPPLNAVIMVHALCFIAIACGIVAIMHFWNHVNWRYITFNGYFANKRYWFPYGFFWSIVLLLNDFYRSNRTKWTISTYGTYENIHLEGGFSGWIWKKYYESKGFKGESLDIRPYEQGDISWSAWQNAY